MRHALAGLMAAVAALALSACETSGQYDGVSRFAHTGDVFGACYDAGRPPRDCGDS